MAFKVRIDRDDLYRELRRIRGVVETRATIPILSNVLLVAERTYIRLTATNLEMTWRTSIPAVVEEPGEITLGATRLWDAVKGAPKGASIELSEDPEGWAKLLVVNEVGRATFRLPTLPAEDFPSPLEYKVTGFNEVGAAVLLQEMIAKVFPAVAVGDPRNALNGALFEQDTASLQATATNGHSLALVKRTAAPETVRWTGSVNIPHPALKELKQLLGGDGADTVLWGESGNRVVFSRGHVAFITNKIDDKFPDYNQVIQTDFKHNVTVDRDGLKAALRHVSTLSHERTKPIILSFRKGRDDATMVVSSNTPEMGEAGQELPVDYKGRGDLEIGFNARYLLDALDAIDDTSVRLMFNGPLDGMQIRSVQDDGYMCRIMPMRV